VKTKNNEAQAHAKLDINTTRKTALVERVQKATEAVQKHPDFATHPEMQQCVSSLGAAADALGGNISAVHALRVQETALLAKQPALVADCKRGVKKLVALVDETTRGSAEGIQQWGLGVQGRSPTVSATPPSGLRATYDANLHLVLRWDAVRGHRGYELQIGDAAGETWSAPVHVPRASFAPTGLVPGQAVSFRVAVHRPSGVSPYSDVLKVTAH